jgi:CRP/FNR family transcriptional regulator, cyclic AMP receptor protein
VQTTGGSLPAEPKHGRPQRSTIGSYSASSKCLLDIDPDLADEVTPDLRRAARGAATALVFDVDPGPVALQPWLNRTTTGPGVLVLEGVLALSVRVGDRTSVELVGTGDVLQTPGDGSDWLLTCSVNWRALSSMRFAALDGAFSRRVRFWPSISQELLRRAARRAINLDVQRAISAQPRLEVRLALLLWHLAGRWGKVEPGGVRLPVPLTHHLLGQLIGAERPSVSHALARLANSGLVTGHGAEWHLHGSLEEELPAMLHPADGRAEQILAAFGTAR